MLWIVDIIGRRNRRGGGVKRSKIRLMEDVASLYSDIFREKPWSENFKPVEVMKIMFEQFFGYKTVMAFAAVQVGFRQREVVGFIWMYEISIGDLKEGTRFSPELKFLFEGNQRVFYLQEVGVAPKHRRKGIGERLITKLLKKARKHRVVYIVVSTNSQAGAAKALFSKFGFKNSGIARPPKELSRTYWILNLGH